MKGTKHVMKVMSQLVENGKKDVSVRLKAADIVNGLHPKDWVGEAKQIQRWVRDNIRYVRDILGVETLHTAPKILELGYGDCDDKTILASAMLQSIGHPTRLKAVGFARGALSHIYPEVKIKGKWYAVETTEPGWELGKEPSNIKSTYIR